MRKSSVSVLLGIGYSILLTFLLCLPGSELPKINWLDKIWFDKWAHIGLFFLLVVLWCFVSAQRPRVPKSLKQTFLGISFFCAIYGFLMELVQHYFIPFRSFDVGDMVADAVGCLGGYYVATWRYIKK